MGNGGSFAASGVYAAAGGIGRSVAPAPALAAWSVLAPMSGQGVPGGHARWAVSRTVATPGGGRTCGRGESPGGGDLWAGVY